MFRWMTMAITSRGRESEAEAVLEGEELAVAERLYDIGEVGEMHHDPPKNVLHVGAIGWRTADSRNGIDDGCGA